MSSRFVWHDLVTADRAKASAFYKELFGWQTSEFDMGGGTPYTFFMVGEVPFGGLNPMDPPPGVPAHWLSTINTTGTIEDACAKTTELGGQVLVPPFEIPMVGRNAILTDPQGAAFSAIQHASEYTGTPMPAYGTPGSPTWNELMTDDPNAAAAYYGAVFGWENMVADMGSGPYHVQKNGEDMVAGIMGKPPGVEMPSAWGIYFEIVQPTIEEAIEKVKSLGGNVLMDPMTVPTVGTFAACQDNVGAWFYLMKSEMPS